MSTMDHHPSDPRLIPFWTRFFVAAVKGAVSVAMFTMLVVMIDPDYSGKWLPTGMLLTFVVVVCMDLATANLGQRREED